MAIESPLLKRPSTVPAVYFLNITGGSNLGLFEVNEAAETWQRRLILMPILSLVP